MNTLFTEYWILSTNEIKPGSTVKYLDSETTRGHLFIYRYIEIR